jgi:hypothetical protein
MDRWRELARDGGSIFDFGSRARLAKEFEVHRSTITRDLAILRKDWGYAPCPTCSSPVSVGAWRERERQGQVTVTER